jgi:hypothetical protein
MLFHDHRWREFLCMVIDDTMFFHDHRWHGHIQNFVHGHRWHEHFLWSSLTRTYPESGIFHDHGWHGHIQNLLRIWLMCMYGHVYWRSAYVWGIPTRIKKVTNWRIGLSGISRIFGILLMRMYGHVHWRSAYVLGILTSRTSKAWSTEELQFLAYPESVWYFTHGYVWACALTQCVCIGHTN